MPKPMPKPVPLPRLVSVPPADPPYDDEREPDRRGGAAGAPTTYGALALAQPPPVARPTGVRSADAVLRAVPDAVPRRETRPAERHLRCLGQAVAEVLAGRRPPETVQGRLVERAYRELVRAGKMIYTERPPVVGPPHVQSPRDGVVEMCLLVRGGARSRVLALRLERFGVRWLITEFETA